MLDSKINTLNDLKSLRDAPALSSDQAKDLLKELILYMNDADWFTIGIMAPSATLAIFILKEMESRFKWPAMQVEQKPSEDGPVFLKANQKTGAIHVRIEYGLGEGVLLSCQHNEEKNNAETFGPFPLDFFKGID